jgi:AGCS family alanine or glycine:cation symporter
MYFNPISIIVSAVGLYLLFRLRFFFILHPIRTFNKISGALKDRTAFRSLTLALAGTLGVGNIFGVCVGLLLGGPGSIFWMLVSSFFAMALKYSEVALCRSFPVRTHEGTQGTMAHCIEATLGKIGTPLSRIYAICTLALALTMGSSLQLMSVSGVYTEIFNTPPAILVVFFLIAVAFAVLGGAGIIKKITAIVIPLTTIIYIILSVSILAIHSHRLPEALLLILDDAFSLDSVGGGVLGFLLTGPVREGYTRGILSNEAGAGTSAMAHARSGLLSPASAGLLGILEVWFDTGLVCMLTGFAILLCSPNLSSFSDGMVLIVSVVGNVFGTTGKCLLIFCVFAFALATVICWYYYGSECWASLFGKRKRAIYLPLFLCFVGLGCFADSMLLVSVTDLLMLVATALTLAALIKNSDRIKNLSELSGVIAPEHGMLRRLRIKGIKGSVFSREGKRR